MAGKSKAREKLAIVTNGLLHENPNLRLVLGTCSTLAITTAVYNCIGMGLATTFVLVCSNMVIAALRKLIPDNVHIPAFITVIAGFVTIVEMLVKGYVPALYNALGVYLPLIVVNCIILARAEMYACKNTVFDSALDGLGMGLGFTTTLMCMGIIRELLGSGTLFGFRIMPANYQSVGILLTPPGGFFVFGCLIAANIWLDNRLGRKTKIPAPEEMGCASCPAAASCYTGEGGCR